MKKLLTLVLVCIVALSLSACSTNKTSTETATNENNVTESSNNEKNEDASKNKEEENKNNEDSVDKSNSSNSSTQSFDEMKTLFVVEGEKVQESIVEGAFSYQISASYEEIVTQMKEGLTSINAVSVSETDVAMSYSYVGTYGDNLSINISVVNAGIDDSCTVSVSYGEDN